MPLTKASYSMINGAPVNVLDYGADPTGVANSTAAFQAALSVDNRPVYVPKGTYLITDTLNLTGTTVIFGDGRSSSSINFKPLTNKYLFQRTSDGSLQITNLLAIGTDYEFDPNPTPAIKSGFLYARNTSSRLYWDQIGVFGFNADKVIDVEQCIETYITRSFFFGPYFNESVPGTTTTRTASCFYFNGPWNTTTNIEDCFIQGWKFGVVITNGFMNTIQRCALEANFIAIVSQRDPTAVPAYPNYYNFVTNCYFELNDYTDGGAGLATDFDDKANSAKFGDLTFQDCYFHQNATLGSPASLRDSPATTYGNVIQTTNAVQRRYLHGKFLSSLQGWSHVENQWDSYLDTVITSANTNTLGDAGFQIGFRRDVNNNGFDKQFRVRLKTGSGVGAHASWCLQSNTSFDNNSPVSDFWDATAQVIRMRIQGGDAYLSGGGAWNTSGADYAEMFEWADGNSSAEDRVGKLVYLDGDKVTLTPNGAPIGVVSATASVVGNNWSEQWSSRLLRDDFGREVLNEAGEIMVNPAFDPNQTYIPRNERKEWAVVGLIGRLRVLADQPVPASWIKLRDISDKVVEYLVK